LLVVIRSNLRTNREMETIMTISILVAVFACACVVGVVGIKAPQIRARQTREAQAFREEQAKDELITITNELCRLSARIESNDDPTAGEFEAIEAKGRAWNKEFGDIASPELQRMNQEIKHTVMRAAWGA